MKIKIIILIIFFILTQQFAHASSYSVDIDKIYIKSINGTSSVDLTITFSTSVPHDEIKYVQIWAQENTFLGIGADWHLLKNMSADEIGLTSTSATVTLYAYWDVNSYKNLNVAIRYSGGWVSSERYGVGGIGDGLGAIEITFPDGTTKVYTEGSYASTDSSQDTGKEVVPSWVEELKNAILQIPQRILSFFLWVPSATLNFLSNLISGAIQGISGSFGIAQPIGAVIVGMGIFVGAYFVIKLILYIV